MIPEKIAYATARRRAEDRARRIKRRADAIEATSAVIAEARELLPAILDRYADIDTRSVIARRRREAAEAA